VPFLSETGGKKRMIWVRLIALFEMIGGLVGIGSTLWVIILSSNVSFTSPLIFVIIIVFIALYAICFTAGLLLWQGRRRGNILSRWVQVVQIPVFTIAGFSYKFIAGLGVLLGGEETGFNFEFFLGSQMSFSGGGSNVLSLGVNAIAIVILIYLLSTRNTWKPIAAGIWDIVCGGFFLIYFTQGYIVILFDKNIQYHQGDWGVLFTILLTLATMALVGGFFALKRKKWRWALAGSIAASLFFWDRNTSPYTNSNF